MAGAYRSSKQAKERERKRETDRERDRDRQTGRERKLRMELAVKTTKNPVISLTVQSTVGAGKLDLFKPMY